MKVGPLCTNGTNFRSRVCLPKFQCNANNNNSNNTVEQPVITVEEYGLTKNEPIETRKILEHYWQHFHWNLAKFGPITKVNLRSRKMPPKPPSTRKCPITLIPTTEDDNQIKHAVEVALSNHGLSKVILRNLVFSIYFSGAIFGSSGFPIGEGFVSSN